MYYSILIHSAEGVFDRLPSEEQAAIFQGHRDLQAALAERGPYTTVKLMPTSHAVTLKPTSEPHQKPMVIDGPFAETKERFLGLYIAEFESLDEAISFAEMISAPFVSLEIRPVAWAGGNLGEG
ncbi:MAG: YciI family protein [Geminicoccaceae bacterium]